MAVGYSCPILASSAFHLVASPWGCFLLPFRSLLRQTPFRHQNHHHQSLHAGLLLHDLYHDYDHDTYTNKKYKICTKKAINFVQVLSAFFIQRIRDTIAHFFTFVLYQYFHSQWKSVLYFSSKSLQVTQKRPYQTTHAQLIMKETIIHATKQMTIKS